MNSDTFQTSKAKSRISSDRKIGLVSENEKLQSVKVHTPHEHWLTFLSKHLLKSSNNSNNPLVVSKLAKKVIVTPRLIWFALSFGLYGVIAALFATVYPSSIANFLLYQGYIPLLMLFLMATALLGKGIFLHNRRAAQFGVFFSLLLFFKLQSVEVNLSVIAVLLFFICSLELIISLVFRK